MQFTFGFVTLALALSASALPVRVSRRAELDLQNGLEAIAQNQKVKAVVVNSLCGEKACVDHLNVVAVQPRQAADAAAPPAPSAPADAQGGNRGRGGRGRNGNNGGNKNGNNGGAPDAAAAGGAPDAATGGAPDATTGAGAGAADGAPNGDNNNGGANNGDNNNAGANNGGAANGDNNGANNGAAANGDNNGGANNGANGGDPQTSLTLDPGVIAQGFANDGQSQPTAGQVASLTSTNNFINFCKTVNLPLTNGAQVAGGSCNPAPMGSIPSKGQMPSSKFVFPKNLATIPANQKFTIQMAIKNLETGNFVNAQQNYFSAPQQLNGQGLIRGHSHVVIEQLESLEQTTPTNPEVFAFFKGLNSAAQGGILTADVDAGLPAGVYKLSSINTAANHQPVVVPVAQHGSLDDAIYFTVA